MILRRTRLMAQTLILIVGVSAAFTASAAGFLLANGVILTAAAWEVLAWVFAIIMGLFAFATAFNKLLVMPVVEKMGAQMAAKQRETIKDGLAEIAHGFRSLMDLHEASSGAHSDAAARRHMPIENKIDKVSEKLDTFTVWCREHQCVAGPRQPSDSPRPHRANDSGDDYTHLRGRQ